MGKTAVWTVGHSTHEMSALADLLRRHRIEVVADVRSYPSSRHNPQFNRKPLRSSLLAAQIEYVFLGQELGGRPPEPEFYDARGHVLYSAVAKSERFASGVERLLTGAATHRVAILCSEENPENCHRRLLVGRVLTDRGVTLLHIRGDGSVVSEEDLGRLPENTVQGALFGQQAVAWGLNGRLRRRCLSRVAAEKGLSRPRRCSVGLTLDRRPGS
jgi:uncharacterized protein (DUF488 family)